MQKPCRVVPCRTGVGAVPRAQLESWLQSHCRQLLAAVDGATMLDMLLQHTFGEAPTRLFCIAQRGVFESAGHC